MRRTLCPAPAPSSARRASSRPTTASWIAIGARPQVLAPRIGAGRLFFSRPVLRVFATYAHWSDGLRGFVGGVPFQNDTEGVTYGVQSEAWW